MRYSSEAMGAGSWFLRKTCVSTGGETYVDVFCEELIRDLVFFENIVVD